MPDYKTHDRIGILTSSLTGVIVGYISEPVYGIHAAASIMIGTWFFSPDLDISSKMQHRWSVFYILWKPYELLIPHRSILSHSGPLSATLRLVYFFGILFAAMYFTMYPLLYDLMGWIHNNAIIVFIWYIGFCIADSIHVIADKTMKGRKHERR